MIHILNHNDEIIDYFDINDGDILEPDMVRNIETLEDTLEFAVLTERSINVQHRNRVIIQDNENVYREFIIMQYESNIDGFTTVSCVGSHLEDFASAKPIEPQRLERYTTNQAITFMAADTGWELAPDNEWSGTRTTSWSSWQDRLSLLKQLQTTYDMRLSFYIELGTNTVKHRYVKLKEVNPMFNGEEIVYGENMIDLKRSVDFTDVATALVALGPEDDDGNRIIIEEHDDEAQEQLGLPYRYLWQIYEPESDDNKMTEKRLRTLARTKLNKIKEASVSYTIQSTQLDVKVGDMIRVKNEDFTPELYVEAEIIEIKYNAYTKLCDYKFGILTEYTRDEVYEQFNRLLETLRKRLENISHNTENIINERFEEELKDLERYIHKSPTPPLNPKEGDLWLDTSHNQVAVLKRYENGQWIKSSVSEAHDINAPTREEAMYQMITERAHRLKNMMLNNFGLYNNLTNHKYYMDLPQEIRDMFSKSFVAQSNAYSKFESDFEYINSEQPTIGLILTAMESAIKFEELSIDHSNAYAQIRAALDNYLEILQRQYSDAKHEEALRAVADKFGLEVVDGMLVGDANFIDNMNEIKEDLQKQLDEARKAFEDLEIGGRNLIPAFTNSRWKIPENGTVIEDYRLKYLANSGHIRSEVNIDVEPNSDYTFTFNTENGRWYIYNEDDSILTQGSSSVSANESTTFNTGENESVRLLLNTWSQLISEDRIFWELQLEKGTVPTDWTPALEDTDNKITNINQSITNIEGQLKSTVNKDTFDLLNETVTKQGTTIEQTAKQLQSKADKSLVDTLSGKVTSQGTLLTQTAKEVSSKANQQELDETKAIVKEQDTNIKQNAAGIALRAKSSELDTVKDRVDKSEADITVNSKKIAAKVDSATYTTDKKGIIERLETGESERVQLSNEISDRVKLTDYNAYKGQQANAITQLETEISQNGKTIALKANQSALDSLDRTLSKKQSELEIEAGRIEGTVKGLNTQLQDATASFKATTDGLKGLVQENARGIGKNTSLIEQKAREINLSIETRTSGGRNLLPYSDLPEDRGHWGTNYSSSGTTLNINNINFSSYLWINKDSTGTGTAIVAASPSFTVVEGKELTISFQATGFQNAYDDMRYMAWIPTGQSNQRIDTPKRTQIGTEANKPVYQYEVTTTPNFTGETYIIFGTRREDVSKAARFYLKNAKVEEGNTASGWSVSPTDTAERWAEIKLTTDKITSEVGKKVGQNEVISSINQTAEKVKIDANKIELTAGSEIRLAVDGLNGLGKASNMLRHTLVSEENLKYFKNMNGGINVDTSVSTLDGQTYYLVRAHGSQIPSHVAVLVNRYADPRIRWEKGKDYKLSFKARKSSRTSDFRYTYIMRNDGANQSLGSPTKITPSEGVNEYLYEFDINPNWSSDEGYILIGLQPESNAYKGYWLRVRDIMLQEGTVATAYVPHSSEMVGTGNLFSAINLDSTNAKISGNKIELVGDVDMVNGTTRIKSLNLNRAVVTGGTGKNVITLNNNEFVSRGYFTRTWAGETDTAQLNLGIWHGRIMISNENTGYNLYLTEKGLSTTMAGATAGYSAGTLEFHSQRFNETSRGVTLHSTFGAVALVSDESAIVTRSRLTNNIESEDYSVYVRPFMKTRPGINEFQFYVKDNSSGLATDGAILFGSITKGSNYGSGIRFKKDNRNRATVYATNLNGDIGTGDFDADQFWGTGFGSKATNLYAMASKELRVTDKRGYNNGNPIYSDIRARKIHTTSNYAFENHGSGNTYFGVGTAEMRITDNNHYNGGNPGYRDIRFANWRAMSHEKYKYDIKEWNLSVLPIFTEELQLHTFKLKTERDSEKDLIHQGIILRENSNDDRFPAEWREGDGFNGNKVLWWTVKGVQELAQENYKKDEIIKEQGAKIEELQKRMREVMALLNK